MVDNANGNLQPKFDQTKLMIYFLITSLDFITFIYLKCIFGSDGPSISYEYILVASSK